MKHQEEISEIRNMINTVNEKKYKDDMVEYSILRPYYTGLKMDIFVDSGAAYLRNHHEPILFVRDGYAGEISFVPVILSNSPYIPESYSFNSINRDDIESVFKFIVANLNGLMELANDDSSITKFTNSIQKVPSMVAETIVEMGQVKTEETGLPISVWLDEGSNPQHALRIKFFASNEQRQRNRFSEMSVEQNPQLFNLPKKVEIPSDYIDILKEYVKNNVELLYLLWKAYIDLQKDFLPNAVRIGDDKLPINARQDVVEMGLPMNGYRIVIDKNGKFNLRNSENKAYASMVWYDRIEKIYIPPVKNRLADVIINGIKYAVFPDNVLKPIQIKKKK